MKAKSLVMLFLPAPLPLNLPVGHGEQKSVEVLLLKVLGWQGEHSVGDVGSCPAGHVAAVSIVMGTLMMEPSQPIFHVFVPVGGVMEVEVM